ncbi:hypothetical protein JCM19046_1608 [Bacillus sp. JCM 19046]|nr:hypothetical protein JCM19045_193 [Bacillus sp. JCM 19045]GAF17125.1 hypothetical protein JCM19046_1608 [Bacillus sp. JCM 19046]
MLEFFNQQIVIILYFCVIFYLNVGYLKDYREIQADLKEGSSEDTMFNTEGWQITLLLVAFTAMRSWIIYFIAYQSTGARIFFLIMLVFIVIDCYHVLFNSRVERLGKTRIPLTRSIIDTVFIVGFLLYLFFIK